MIGTDSFIFLLFVDILDAVKTTVMTECLRLQIPLINTLQSCTFREPLLSLSPPAVPTCTDVSITTSNCLSDFHISQSDATILRNIMKGKLVAFLSSIMPDCLLVELSLNNKHSSWSSWQNLIWHKYKNP